MRKLPERTWMKSIGLVLIALCIAIDSGFAQHDHHNIAPGKDSIKKDEDAMPMRSFFSPHYPMSRDGSGTGWQPDSSPMWMYMMHKGNTSYMIHGTVFLRYTSQDITNQSDRGGHQLDAPNMFMFMLSRRLDDRNLFSIQTMFSLDPLTVGNNGYPLLFQTGESYKGIPLVDRQHPHDFFAGLAISYTHSLTPDIDILSYLGYPGEPALGPVVFMHRLSAMNNPDAPLGHHWQDATHIAFGVGTLGLRYKNVKVEGSVFTGREPDEHRFDFDRPRFDSYTFRITANPSRQMSAQFSRGFIKSPEALFADEDITRTTASVTHTKTFSREKFISSSGVWGMNQSHDGENLNSFLLESNLQLRPVILYTRYEFIEKDVHELQLDQFEGNPKFIIHAWTAGINKILMQRKAASASIGIQGTIHFPDPDLKSIYGNHPLSGQIYLKIFPPASYEAHH